MNIFWNPYVPENEDYPKQRQQRSSAKTSSPKRERWKNDAHFMLGLLGYVIGLGNMWRFPYLCFEFGGGTFLLCYFVAATTVAVPYFFLELTLGQFLQTGILGIGNLCMLLKGVGWAALMIACYSNIVYVVILAWITFYLFSSFQVPPPWQYCNHTWNTNNCIAAKYSFTANYMSNGTVSSVVEFWERRVLQRSDGLEHPDNMQWELIGTLLLMWCICFFSIWKGILWVEKVVYVTVLGPYLFVLCLLPASLCFEGSVDGIRHYLMPNSTLLMEKEVWFKATTQALYSLGVGFGALTLLGSFNKYHTNIYRHALLAATIDVLTSIFLGLFVFAIVGILSKVKNRPIKDIALNEKEVAFLLYPAIMLELPWPNLWAILVFLIFFMLGIDSQFLCVFGVVIAVFEEYQNYIKIRRELFIFGCCFAYFCVGLLCVTRGGIYVHTLLEFSNIGWNSITVVLLESCLVAYVYGINKYYSDLEDMLGFRPSLWWKICWVGLSPTILFIIIIMAILQQEPMAYQNYPFPKWAKILAWFMSFAVFIFIPINMIYCIATLKGSLTQRLKKSIQPSDKLLNRKRKVQKRETEPDEPETGILAFLF